MPPLILASGSPRRKRLLALLGLSYDVIPSDVDETAPPNTPPTYVASILACRKAKAVAESERVSKFYGGPLVLGVDTIVVEGDQILGKPADPDEARDILRQLRNKRHEVTSGLCLVDKRTEEHHSGAFTSQVTMREVPDDEVEAYIATDEPYDKAGGYAIQGKAGSMVKEIEGCYPNIVGLPLCQVAMLLDQADVDIDPTQAIDYCESQQLMRGRCRLRTEG